VDLSKDRSRALVVRVVTNLDAELLLIDRAAGTTTTLTSRDDECWILGAAFDPDERSVWALTNHGREFVRLERLDLESMKRTPVVEADWDVEAFAVSPDGESLAWSVNRNGWSEVFIRTHGGGRPDIRLDVPMGTVDRMEWSPDSTVLAFGMSTATEPSRVFVADHAGTVEPIALPVAGPEPPVVEPELVHFPTFDGLDIPAFLFRPIGEGPFPVLVEIHGGPESQRRLQYSSAVPTDQLVQSLGVAVLSLNVRGSTGYGKTFSHLDDKGLRLDAVRDVAAAVDWLRTRDDVRADRIGVMGQSYGGFMTLASICFHPDLWAAAVDVVGIANFVTFMERTGSWRRAHRAEEYGSLEEDRALLERISPLNHVGAITTPLFVIHGRNDPRVPLHEAEQIVAALSERKQQVELRVFDNEGHGLSKRENRIAGYAEAALFLVNHLDPHVTSS
ncbi:MAG: S9 family peptidase, partial [Chloroflexia bacterium]|nr:S9 family peptidase [Chloroflexia bacterium]